MVMDKNEIIRVTSENIENEHICCAIGDDKKNSERAKVKKAWLAERFKDGHIFKKLNVRGKVFIEYSPAEKAWYPVIADGYMFIQCFWVSGKFKGQGISRLLLEECKNDSKDKNGIVALATKTKKPYMIERKFYEKMGFKIADSSDMFDLMVLKNNQNAPDPKFTERAKKGECEDADGFVIYYSDACPFNAPFANEMIETAIKRNVPTKLVKVTNLKEAKELPTPFSIASIFYNGKLTAYGMMTEKMFNKLIDEQLATKD
jgi:GNAT superfamily N-acetyltransferase